MNRGADPRGTDRQSAALGMLTQVEAMLQTQPAPTPDQLDEAFWQACHGGQRRMASR
jgi:hypothetical protein